MEDIKIKVCECYDGLRIDKFLTSELKKKSRSHIQILIKNHNVTANSKIIKSNYKVKTDDIIEIKEEEPKLLKAVPQNIKLDILYEDSDVIVVNKPQGMVVHPANGNPDGTLVNALLYHCKDLSSINGVIRPGIVHRIDKDTSGILVAAKNDYAHNILSMQLKEHSMNREYIALVNGILKSDSGKINKPLGRNPKDRLKMAIVEGGKRAVTNYSVLERFKEYTLIKCVLETGRTHQIRVHMASIGHPLVGDPLYGYKKQHFKLKGQMLHAKKLGFIHPVTKEYMEFVKDEPEYFKEIINKLRNIR
ncbi:RluA family pseudouridine synthase [Clostridium sp. BJN0001]|uniref:RluA family pseudouridine synthase n=1 Tax=Clostridium sp. BJN0001 TaxID=2930219 RepID=UPI001FD159D4|nr:RluA family pseudouridine synthase [Clostridium sp. BJN0001]